MTCKKVIGVATAMKEKYGESLEVKIMTTDSEEAQGYHFRSSTNVFFNGEVLALDVATDSSKLDLFLTENL